MPHARTDEDRAIVMEAARSIMVHTARRQELITYADLNQQMSKDTDTEPFDLSQDADRDALGALLADVVKEDLLHSRFMLSSVATLSEVEREPGSEFYMLAENLGHLEFGASRERKYAFWAEQLKLTHDHYKRRI
ncbi:hypothetical protein [Arthrobacter antioxidans]|uniref:hypothetical protein n=1 Tax=Arthrobacter antioxidans TaxID=2895818 RepID=UPI001FFF2AEB|nr:hypothetical protein [Arthrobacter antioxidans]